MSTQIPASSEPSEPKHEEKPESLPSVATTPQSITPESGKRPYKRQGQRTPYVSLSQSQRSSKAPASPRDEVLQALLEAVKELKGQVAELKAARPAEPIPSPSPPEIPDEPMTRTGYKASEIREMGGLRGPRKEDVIALVQTQELERRMKATGHHVGGVFTGVVRQPFSGHHDDASIVVR